MYHRFDHFNICGGTIFSETAIVTAAHCCEAVNDNWSWNSIQVVAGELDLNKYDTTEQRRAIFDHIVHPLYNPRTFHNDVCILILEKPLELNSGWYGWYARGLPLATEDPPVGSECTISGWGAEYVIGNTFCT